MRELFEEYANTLLEALTMSIFVKTMLEMLNKFLTISV